MGVTGNDHLSRPADEGVLPCRAAQMGEVIEFAFLILGHLGSMGPSQWDMSKQHLVGRIADDGIKSDGLQPIRLFAAQTFQSNASAETRVIVRFILAGMQADKGHRTIAECNPLVRTRITESPCVTNPKSSVAYFFPDSPPCHRPCQK